MKAVVNVGQLTYSQPTFHYYCSEGRFPSDCGDLASSLFALPSGSIWKSTSAQHLARQRGETNRSKAGHVCARTTTSRCCVQVLASALMIYNRSVSRALLYLVRRIKMHFRIDFVKVILSCQGHSSMEQLQGLLRDCPSQLQQMCWRIQRQLLFLSLDKECSLMEGNVILIRIDQTHTAAHSNLEVLTCTSHR